MCHLPANRVARFAAFRLTGSENNSGSAGGSRTSSSRSAQGDAVWFERAVGRTGSQRSAENHSARPGDRGRLGRP
jgi:hypothetical protein